ncbi:MAG: hypothetical protein LBU65_07775 [Planctomycetaceae bacterium]|jgi:hypothetical protein|nr:hypothetical protein [Planctomycetaceae bacterium]
MPDSFFAKRRYHNAGNKPDETVESYLKKQQYEFRLAFGLSFLLGILGIIGFVLLRQLDDSRPASSILEVVAVLVTTCLICCPLIAIPCLVISVAGIRLHRDCSRGFLGRWVITSHGIHHRFGKSPARFAAWSDVHTVQYDARKKQIIFETGTVPLVIATWVTKSEHTEYTPILPFLNKLVELL